MGGKDTNHCILNTCYKLLYTHSHKGKGKGEGKGDKGDKGEGGQGGQGGQGEWVEIAMMKYKASSFTVVNWRG